MPIFRSGVRVRNTARKVDGTIVRGPRRASASMAWVLHDGDTEPKHTGRWVLRRISKVDTSGVFADGADLMAGAEIAKLMR